MGFAILSNPDPRLHPLELKSTRNTLIRSNPPPLLELGDPEVQNENKMEEHKKNIHIRNQFRENSWQPYYPTKTGTKMPEGDFREHAETHYKPTQGKKATAMSSIG